jgi:hypothetical protein
MLPDESEGATSETSEEAGKTDAEKIGKINTQLDELIGVLEELTKKEGLDEEYRQRFTGYLTQLKALKPSSPS